MIASTRVASASRSWNAPLSSEASVCSLDWNGSAASVAISHAAITTHLERRPVASRAMAPIARGSIASGAVLRCGETTPSLKGRTMLEPVTEPKVEEPPPVEEAVDDLVEEELLVEDVSIDGMCGVY
jgi:mycofactocin precursor